MPGYRRQFELEVLTPTGAVVTRPTVSVTLPAVDGQVGVLANRSPMVALLGAGRLSAENADGDEQVFFVSGGFARVGENEMTVLAEECVPIEQIDRERAWELIRQAEAMPVDTAEARQRRRQLQHAARERFRLAQEQWRKRHGGAKDVFDRE